MRKLENTDQKVRTEQLSDRIYSFRTLFPFEQLKSERKERTKRTLIRPFLPSPRATHPPIASQGNDPQKYICWIPNSFDILRINFQENWPIVRERLLLAFSSSTPIKKRCANKQNYLFPRKGNSLGQLKLNLCAMNFPFFISKYI